MAIATLLAIADNSAVTCTHDTWTSVIGGAKTVTGLGGVVSILGYADDLDYSAASLRVVIDGTEECSVNANPIAVNKTLSIGSHTIDIQAFTYNVSQTANIRGVTALAL